MNVVCVVCVFSFVTVEYSRNRRAETPRWNGNENLICMLGSRGGPWIPIDCFSEGIFK
jgi:hypothetical protein